MNINKRLLNETQDFLVASNKMKAYITFMTFSTVNHLNFGNVIKIDTLNAIYYHEYKKYIVLDIEFNNQYECLKKLLNSAPLSVLKEKLTEENYNKYKTALNFISQIIIKKECNYNEQDFDLFYFLYLSTHISNICKYNNIKSPITKSHVLSNLFYNMYF